MQHEQIETAATGYGTGSSEATCSYRQGRAGAGPGRCMQNMHASAIRMNHEGEKARASSQK